MAKNFYHGTSMRDAFGVLESGEILSPWYQKVRSLEKEDEDYRRFILDLNNVDSVEEAALEEVSGLYADHELEYRAKSVSLTSDFDLARSYAKFYDECYGVVLGLSNDYVDSFEEKGRGVIYVPKLVSIENSLKEIFWISEKGKSMSWYLDFLSLGQEKYGVEPKILGR